jgi:hypothetical protein
MFADVLGIGGLNPFRVQPSRRRVGPAFNEGMDAMRSVRNGGDIVPGPFPGALGACLGSWFRCARMRIRSRRVPESLGAEASMPRANQRSAKRTNLSLNWKDGRGGLIRVTRHGSTEAVALPGLSLKRPAWLALDAPNGGSGDTATREHLVESTGNGGRDQAGGRSWTGAGHPRFRGAQSLFSRSDARRRSARSGTHLHLLLKLPFWSILWALTLVSIRAQADAYESCPVGESDDLDLVYVSYLTQPGVDIVSNDYISD